MATVQDHGAASNIAQYTYLGPQRVLQRQYQNGSELTYLDNSGTTDIGYDPLRRTVERRDLTGSNSLITGFAYSYDREDNKNYEQKLHQTADSELYSYDSAYRLTQFASGQLNGAGTAIVGSPASTEAWTLDGVGNWRADTINGAPDNRSVNSVNEYSSVNGGALVYDSNGNLINSGLTYQWDYRNRLRQICSGAASCTSPGAQTVAVYSYDAMNRRTRKVVTNSASLNGTTNFYYDGWQTIEERDGTDTETQQYVYGIFLDEPLTLDLSNGSRYFYHQNTLYSTYALTNMSGGVVEGYRYDAYGVAAVLAPDFSTVVGSASTVGNPYMFTGQRLDPETGLMYYKNRYYSPVLGRFLSRDPKEDVDINLFSYVGDRPTGALDPLGLWCQLIRKTNRVVWQGDCPGLVEFAHDVNLADDLKSKMAVQVCREFFSCESGGGSTCTMTTGNGVNQAEGPVPRRTAARLQSADDPPVIAGNMWTQISCCCTCRPPANAANPAQPAMPQAGNGGGGGGRPGGGQGQGQGGQGQGNRPNNQGQGQGNRPNNQGQGQGNRPNNQGQGNRPNPKPVAPKPQPIPKKK
jgi:RHS repeat-associated protein